MNGFTGEIRSVRYDEKGRFEVVMWCFNVVEPPITLGVVKVVDAEKEKGE